MRNNLRFEFTVMALAICSCSSLALASVPAPPPGWTIQETSAGTQYNNADGTAVVLEGVSMASNPTVKMAAQTIDRPGACEGLTGQPVQKTPRGVDKIAVATGTTRCAVYLDTTVSPPRLLVSLDQADGSGLVFAETIVSGWGRAELSANQNGASKLVNQTAPITGNDSALITAMSAVPKSNRPVGVVSQTIFDYAYNGPTITPISYTVHWYAFPNGYATNCSGWDPAELDVTPGALGAAMKKSGENCDVVSWIKNGKGAKFSYPEDVNGPPDAQFFGHSFSPGERIEADIGNVQVFGSVGHVPDGFASARGLSGGDLQMTKAGEIAIGSWSSIAIDSTAVVGGSSRSNAPRTGRYYLDGNIIAVQDTDGRISRRLISGFLDTDNKKGNLNAWYLTNDGEQYYPTD